MKYYNLTPYFSKPIWGGDQIARLKKLAESETIGESWEVSVLPNQESLVHEAPLSELVERSKIPYLIKLIDTNDHLSIQVHPDAKASKQLGGSSKTECWLILDANENAGIYLGFKRGTTKEAFLKSISNKENISSLLNFYPVKRGDFFFVPAGTVHAIGKGVFLAEVQQSSGTTYRVWDWNRVDRHGNSRELHLNEALESLHFQSELNDISCFKVKKNLFTKESDSLVTHDDFQVELYHFESDDHRTIKLTSSRAVSFVALDGSFDFKINNEVVHLSSFSSLIFDLSINCDLEVSAVSKPANLLLVR